MNTRLSTFQTRRTVGALLTGLALGAAAVASAASLPAGFVEDVIVSDLDEPNSFAFLPDGRLLVSEQRTGRVRMIVNGRIATYDPALTVPNLTASEEERGLEGIAIDPRWPQAPYLYVCYTHSGDREWLVRYKGAGFINDPGGQILAFVSPVVLLDGIPDANDNHNAGTLRFGPDGHLFLSVGEDAEPCLAQENHQLAGKLLRLDVTRIPDQQTGRVPHALLIPHDNPISTGDSNSMLVYASGFRNPWRFHVDSWTGIPYVGDVGQDTWEEIDEVYPGDNFGWPFREAHSTNTVPDCTEPGGSTYAGPIAALNHSDDYYSILTAGVYRRRGVATDWPAGYEGNVFFGDYFSGNVRRLARTGGVWGAAPAVPGQPNARDWARDLYSSVDFLFGPDGQLWWIQQWNDSHDASSGSVRRIRSTTGPLAVEEASADFALAGAPNPFRGSVTLSVVLPRRANVEMAIFDVSGRMVRAVASGERPAGLTRFTWDGRDDSGREVAAGVYLARAARGRQQLTRRLMLVR